jgi:TusA-related sulfurtransferase
MKEINCLGDICPVPMMKLKQCQDLKNSGDCIKLITDHSCVLESIIEHCNAFKLNIEIVEPMNGIWELYIQKP